MRIHRTRTWQRAQLLWWKQRIQERCLHIPRKNILDCRHKAEAYQIRTSWEKLFQHVSTKYRQDISNDLNNKIKVKIVTPVHSIHVLVRHATREALVRTGQYSIQKAYGISSSWPFRSISTNEYINYGQQYFQSRLWLIQRNSNRYVGVR